MTRSITRRLPTQSAIADGFAAARDVQLSPHDGPARNALLLAVTLAALGGVAAAQAPPLQFGKLGKRHLPLRGATSIAAAVGDVDGDGDLDLLVANYGARNRLYLNDGTASFVDAAIAMLPPGPGNSTCLACGDVDGDGDLDLVVGGFAQQNQLFLNDGSGTFVDVTAAQMPADTDNTMSVALGDVSAGPGST